jgi:hypothetical protein
MRSSPERSSTDARSCELDDDDAIVVSMELRKRSRLSDQTKGERLDAGNSLVPVLT